MDRVDDREQRILGLAAQVVLLARKWAARTPVPYEELESAAWLGAIKAVDKFNPARASLQTFAARRITGEILDYLRSIDPVSRRVRKETKGSHWEPVHVEADTVTLVDPDRSVAVVEAMHTVDELTRRAKLTGRQAYVIERFYYDGVRPKDIAIELGCHQSRVGQLKTQALKLLRTKAA